MIDVAKVESVAWSWIQKYWNKILVLLIRPAVEAVLNDKGIFLSPIAKDEEIQARRKYYREVLKYPKKDWPYEILSSSEREVVVFGIEPKDPNEK